AAADVAALQAEAEMHPRVAAGEALLASLRRVGFALILLRRDRAEVLASVHGRNRMPKGDRGHPARIERRLSFFMACGARFQCRATLPAGFVGGRDRPPIFFSCK